jgi:hypothetical protein
MGARELQIRAARLEMAIEADSVEVPAALTSFAQALRIVENGLATVPLDGKSTSDSSTTKNQPLQLDQGPQGDARDQQV